MPRHLFLQAPSSKPVVVDCNLQVPRQQPESRMGEVTPESIAAAKLAQLRERQQVFEQAGVRVDEDGRFILPGRETSFVGLGLTLANAMTAAVYGERGEWR